MRRGIAFALPPGMTRIAVVLLSAASLSGWAPARVVAQESLKGDRNPYLLAAAMSAPRARLVGRAYLDREALRAATAPAPWRPSLSTEPITALPGRLSWNRAHTVLAGVFVVGLMIDAAQTRALARGGWSNFREANPLLGKRPSVGQINTYTALAGLSVLGTAAALPPRARPWLLGAAIAVQAVTVARSVQLGLPLRFP